MTQIAHDGPIVTRDEASIAGLKRYFTGNPCKHGHISQRRVQNGECHQCRLNNLEIWRQTENGKKSNRANVARYARTAHGKLVFKAITEKYRKTEKAKFGAAIRASKRRAIKRTVGGTFTKNDARKLMKHQKKCHICGRRFTKENDPATFDHVIPLAKGGTHDASNIALAHFLCNSRKRDKRTHLI